MAVPFAIAVLAGVAVSADGNLLFTDDANGVMYRVSYVPWG